MPINKKRKYKKDLKKKKTNQNLEVQNYNREMNLYLSLQKSIIKNIPQAFKDKELTNLTLSKINSIFSIQTDYTEKEIIDAIENVFYTSRKEEFFEMILWEIESNYEELCKTGIYRLSILPFIYLKQADKELKENNTKNDDILKKIDRINKLMIFGIELNNNYLIKQNYPEFYSIIKIVNNFTKEELESIALKINNFKDLKDFIKKFPKESEKYTTNNRILNEKILEALNKNENIVIEHKSTGEGTSYDNDIYNNKEVYVILSYYNIYFKNSENYLSEALNVSVFSKIYYN